jgi:hypothetical protein
MEDIRAALAQPEGEGPSLAEVDEKELLRVYCNARRGYCYDGPEDDWPKRAERAATVHGLRAVLTRWGRPAARPAPEAAPEPRNPTMDEVMALAKSFRLEVNDQDALMWLVVTAIAAWGDAFEAPPAPEAGEVGELVAVLLADAECLAAEQPDLMQATNVQLTRAATLLQQQEARIASLRSALAESGRAVGSLISDDCSDGFLLQVPAEVRLAAVATAPAVVPVAVSERLPESGDLDANGRCWVYQNGNSTTHWLSASAIPLPQAEEVQS